MMYIGDLLQITSIEDIVYIDTYIFYGSIFGKLSEGELIIFPVHKKHLKVLNQ